MVQLNFFLEPALPHSLLGDLLKASVAHRVLFEFDKPVPVILRLLAHRPSPSASVRCYQACKTHTRQRTVSILLAAFNTTDTIQPTHRRHDIILHHAQRSQLHTIRKCSAAILLAAFITTETIQFSYLKTEQKPPSQTA